MAEAKQGEKWEVGGGSMEVEGARWLEGGKWEFWVGMWEVDGGRWTVAGGDR